MRHPCLLGLIVLLGGCDTILPAQITDGPVAGNLDGGFQPGSEGGVPGSDGGGYTGGNWKLPPLTGQLPTFVDLDWNAFPPDPGPDYPATTREWVVKTTGKDGAAGTETSPLRRIGEAATIAGVGDVIRVYGGTYDEPDGVNILSENVVLTAASGQQVTLAVPNKGLGIRISAGYGVVVNGINIKGCTTCIDLGLPDKTQRNIVISNLRIDAGTSDFSDGIVANYNTSTLGFATIEGLLIKNVQINGASLAISCGSGTCNSWRIENVRVKAAQASGWGADGIAVEKGDNMLLYGVEVSNSTSDGIDMKATRVVVWGCNVHNVTNNGVKLWHGGDIVNSLINGNGLHEESSVVSEAWDGVGDRLRLLHTTIANQSVGGYVVALGYDTNPAMKVEIIDSIFYKSWGAVFVAAKSDLKIQNSVFFDFGSRELLRREESGEPVQDVAGLAKYGSGNLVADPQLDETFHLRQGSPAIDKGLALPSTYPSTDGAGQPRVKGAGPDIGPFEDY